MSKLTDAKERIGLVTEISMLPSLGVTGPVLDELLKARDRLLAEAAGLLREVEARPCRVSRRAP